MRLQDKDRKKVIDQIRKGLKKELKSFNIKKVGQNETAIDNSCRIKLPKEYEDEILFNYYSDISGRKFKEFAIKEDLYKIDLSSVDLSYICLEQDKKDHLDLSYSNLNMDFTKTYQFIYNMNIEVANVNFSHMDLSNCNFYSNVTTQFENCDLSYTNLHLNNNGKEEVRFYSCDLTGNDFSNLSFWFNGTCFGSISTMNILTRNCNLMNTGVNIALFEKEQLSNREKENLKDALIKGNLNGCYIDGKKVYSKDEWSIARERAASKYLDFINDEANRVLDDIRLQISSSDKKTLDEFDLDDKSDDKVLGVGSFYGCDNVPEEPKKKYVSASYPSHYPPTPKKISKKGVKKNTLKRESSNKNIDE